MTRRVPPEIDFRWPGGSFRAVGIPALVLVAVLGIGYLVMAHWERLLG
jgi:hypothetical protein